MSLCSFSRASCGRTVCYAALAPLAVMLLISPAARAQNLFFGDAGSAYGRPDYFFTSDLDGAGLTNILTPSAVVVSLDVDAAAQRVFWQEVVSSGSGQWRIRSAPLNGASPVTVANYTGGYYGLAVDAINQRLYWADGQNITRTDYNGANPITIATGVYTQAIEVDPANGRVFWADQDILGIAPRLMMANLDGTSPQTLGTFAAGSNYLSGLTVDPVAQTLFWSDLRAGTVSSIPYSGGSPTIIHSGLLAPAGLDLELTTNRLYIVQRNAISLSWSSPAGGALTQVFMGGGQTFGEMWDVAAIIPAPGAAPMVAIVGFALVRRRR